MDSQNKTARSNGFNVVDLLLLFLVLLLVVVFVYILFFSDVDLIGELSNKSEKKTVEYVFEIGPVDKELFGENGTVPFEAGGNFYTADGKKLIGKVLKVSALEPYFIPTSKTETSGEGVVNITYAEHPKKSVFTVTVQADAVLENGTYYINGTAIKIGSSFEFLCGIFSGECNCISVKEVPSDGE